MTTTDIDSIAKQAVEILAKIRAVKDKTKQTHAGNKERIET